MATPSHLRRLHERQIVSALRRVASATRGELARTAGISLPTAGKIVDDLLSQRILEAAPADSNGGARLGRPAQSVRLDAARKRFLAVQLGVIHTRLSMVALAAPDIDRWDVEFPTPGNPQEWARRLEGITSRLETRQLEAVLLSVPGLVDERTGQSLLCPNLRWVEQAALRDLVRSVWPVPLCVMQEIRALALGQLALAPEQRDFLLVDFGDGVGGAFVVGGELFQSSIPLSGEMGHTPVLGNKRKCGCGAVGCVETLVSRSGLLKSFAADQPRVRHTWQALASQVWEHGLSPWLREALDAAAVTIAGALNVLGLRHVVITGSLTELPETAVQYLSEAVRRGSMWARFGEVTCIGAPRRRLAGLVSAAIDRIVLPQEGESGCAPGVG